MKLSAAGSRVAERTTRVGPIDRLWYPCQTRVVLGGARLFDPNSPARWQRWAPPVLAAVALSAGCASEPTEQARSAVTVGQRGTSPTSGPRTASPTPDEIATSTPVLTAQSEPPSTNPDVASTTTVVIDPPPANGQFTALSFDLDLVTSLPKPTGIAWRDGDPGMYVTTQAGPVYRVAEETTVVVDLTEETFEDLPGSERGVLGIAFDPRDGRMFIDLTDESDDTEVISFEVVDGVAVPESRRTVLTIEQPGVGHNGGRLLFDRHGNLYVGSGDGGASNGRDAQDTSKLLGAILRVTPRLDGDGYDIPSDNPFVDGVLDQPEVIARGFRNPWGFSLDEPTGDLWVGDVGNSDFEEIDVMRAGQFGQNFGWPYFEGSHQRKNSVPDGLTLPVHDYPRTDGVAVMGGSVYRGSALPGLRGAYVFGDLTGPIWAIGTEGVSRLDAPAVNAIVGWGVDPAGELYVLGLYDGVYRLVAG